MKIPLNILNFFGFDFAINQVSNSVVSYVSRIGTSLVKAGQYHISLYFITLKFLRLCSLDLLKRQESVLPFKIRQITP